AEKLELARGNEVFQILPGTGLAPGHLAAIPDRVLVEGLNLALARGKQDALPARVEDGQEVGEQALVVQLAQLLLVDVPDEDEGAARGGADPGLPPPRRRALCLPVKMRLFPGLDGLGD